MRRPAYKEVCTIEDCEWCLSFDGSSTHQEVGAGILLYALEGTDLSRFFKLEFTCSNNKTKYKALIFRLTSALQMKI